MACSWPGPARLRVIMLIWLKHNYIQQLKNMRRMPWKSERNNAVVVAVLDKLNGMMGAVAIQKKKSFRTLCKLS
jgi:hypothetical protein